MPAGRLLRRIDAILGLDVGRGSMAPNDARGGRPPVDLERPLRMLPAGYLHGARSERRPCEAVDPDLADRRFRRPGLDGRVPDHSTFTKDRRGRLRGSGPMREVFERVIEQGLAAGPARTDKVVVAGSHIAAGANEQRRVKADEERRRAGEGATRAVRDGPADLEMAAPDPVGVTRRRPRAVSTADPAAAFHQRPPPPDAGEASNRIVRRPASAPEAVHRACRRTGSQPDRRIPSTGPGP